MEHKLTDETIMPDGRPLFAWRNEIEMTRSEYQRFDAKKRELGILMHLLNMVKVEQTQEFHTGDYLFRVCRSSIVHETSPMKALENAEITRV